MGQNDIKTRKATIVDIANLANVTNITVSRAFSSPELVKKETRDRIYAIARKLHYTPNPFARSLKTNTSKIIGVVTNSTYNPVYEEVIKTLCLEADKNGYIVIMFESACNPELENRAMQTLFAYKVAGIVLSVVNDCAAYDPLYIKQAQAYNIPLILLDRDITPFNLPGVFLDNYQIGVKAGKYLFTQNLTDLLVIGGPEDSLITQKRIEGIMSELRDLPVKFNFIYTDYSYALSRKMIMDYLKEKIAETSYIVGINGLITLAAIGVCRTLGNRQCRYFSIDAVPYAADLAFNIPCIYSDPKEWGMKVSELLFTAIKSVNNPEKFERIFISGELMT